MVAGVARAWAARGQANDRAAVRRGDGANGPRVQEHALPRQQVRQRISRAETQKAGRRRGKGRCRPLGRHRPVRIVWVCERV